MLGINSTVVNFKGSGNNKLIELTKKAVATANDAKNKRISTRNTYKEKVTIMLFLLQNP